MHQRLNHREYVGADGIRLQRHCAKSVPIHSHDYFELEIVLQGRGRMALNEQAYALQPGSVYLLTPADFHAVELADNLLWNISFDQSVPDSSLLEVLFAAGSGFRTVDARTLQRLDQAAQLLQQEQDPVCCRLLLTYLLKTAGLPTEQNTAPTPIQRAMVYIQTRFREDPTLAETAAHVGQSPSYFGSLFREEVGETYVSYLNGCKVRCAAMLLRRGKSVTEACFDAGFGSLSGFRYVFHQKTGKNPSDCRDF